MHRRTFTRGAVATVAAGAALPAWAAVQSRAAAEPKSTGCDLGEVTETHLPHAHETHDILQLPDAPVALISQMDPSTLVKVTFNERTGLPRVVKGFPLGGKDAYCHGMAVSRAHPGKVWVTLENEHRILLIDPHPDRPKKAPTIERTIDLPEDARGPHYVGEYGDELWSTCKASGTVLRINHRDPKKYEQYASKVNDPIFIAQHPRSKNFYVSEIRQHSVLRIDPRTGDTKRFDLTAHGTMPVGLVAGPTDAWVVLLGSTTAGTGTFGRITADDTIEWFKLSSPKLADAALLHLSFAPDAARHPAIWLLGSTSEYPDATDQVIRVTFDRNWRRITSESSVPLPTQQVRSHRILARENTVHVTELTVSKLATLSVSADCAYDSAQA